jgi:hypothetical protein
MRLSPRLQAAGVLGALDMLCRRHDHLLALRIADSVGAPQAFILQHWATSKIVASTASQITDAELLNVIDAKLKVSETA